MMNDPYKDQFLKAADDWVCESYSIDIRYIAKKEGEIVNLLGALINLTPLPATVDFSFCIETEDLYAGQIQLPNQPKNKLIKLLQNAANGRLEVKGNLLTLPTDRPYNYFAELASGGDQWFSDLHLQIVGNLDTRSFLSHVDVCRIDNTLRKSTPPFDGMVDLTGWLGIKNSHQAHDAPSINIHVHPPVDLNFPECRMDENKLHLILVAHPGFDISRVALAVRAVPGVGIEDRRQATSNVKWKRANKLRRIGGAKIAFKEADSALVMLMIGDATVRRQWFLDTAKSSNNRLAATQLFDRDLRMIKQALFETNESSRFENGVAALFFLMGFSPAIQLEKDAPDIIVTTPGGRIILVECTTRVADFSKKLGKLVDRKGSLTKKFVDNQNFSRVDAVLVCGLPRDQILIRHDELKAHQIILIAREELVSAFEQLRFHADPDKLVEDALKKSMGSDSIGINKRNQ